MEKYLTPITAGTLISCGKRRSSAFMDLVRTPTRFLALGRY